MSNDALPWHAAFGISQGIHAVVAGTIADASALASGIVDTGDGQGAVAVAANDVDKVFRRTDSGDRYLLRSHSPVVWERIGSLWTQVPYSTAIPFTDVAYMPAQSVTGAITFTANSTGARAGGSCYLRLTANGTNVPSFSGMTQHPSSMGWNNTNGTVNYLTFWYDGTSYFYQVLS